MTQEPNDCEKRSDEHSRRSVLKAAGGVASALAGVAAVRTVGAQTSQTVDIVAEGADSTGETPIDDILQAAVASNTKVVFPDGTYRLGGFAADGLQNVSLVGENATLVPPNGSTDQLLALSGTNVSVEGFTFDYTAPNTAPMVTMQCTDGLELKNCEFVGVADVMGGTGSSGHQYHFLPAITSPEGSGLVKNVTMADGTISPSNRGGIWFGSNNLGTMTFDGLHVEQFANNSLYVKDSGGPVVVKNSFFRNNNVGGPRIGSNGTRVIDTTVVSDGHVPVAAFSDARWSRGVWVQDACDDVLIEGCNFVMSGPHAAPGIVYEVPNTNADVKDCRFTMDVDHPAIQCSVAGGPISIEGVNVAGDAAGTNSIDVVDRATVSDVCIQGVDGGNSCAPESAGSTGNNDGPVSRDEGYRAN